MSTVLVLGPVLLVVGALGVALVELLVRRADVAAALVLGSVVVQAAFVDSVPSLLLQGGTRVYVTDLVSALLLGAALLRLLRMHHFDRFHRWLTLLGIVLLVSLVRGVAAFGSQASIADFRQYLFFAGAALYFASFPLSVGVANLRDFAERLHTWPAYLTEGKRGAGFAEVAARLLSLRPDA